MARLRMQRTESLVEPPSGLGVVAVNHIACHIYPKTGGTWRDTIEELRQRSTLFDGRRVFGIVHGDGLDEPEAVQDYIGDLASDFIVHRNEPSLREVMTLPSMLSRLQGIPGRVFYCHSKGATHHAESICQEWRRVMMEVCLDFPRLIDCMMARHPVVGPFRRIGDMLGVPWHFSGSFYWIDCGAIWSRNWGDVHQVWYGVESYPGIHFSREEAGCLFLDNTKDLYEADYWEKVVRPALASWRAAIRSCTAS